jgi:DNA (cytosine-5)-methyltransferase 1
MKTTPRDRHARMAVALNKFCGLSQERIGESVGVAYSTVARWIHDGRKPQGRAREAIAKLFGQTTAASDVPEEVARSIVAILFVRYGSPRLGNKADPLDELFFILLSLKTTHLIYEETYKAFRQRFFPWSKLLRVDVEDVQEHIRRGGLGSIKAKAFLDIVATLKRDFGKVTLAPLKRMSTEDAQKYLLKLPGVGIKTARCVMMYSLNRDKIPVDTHTYRVGVRLGLIPTSRNPDAAHGAFDAVIPSGLAYALHTNFVALGTDLCQEMKPRCIECPLREMCRYAAATPTKTPGVRIGRHNRKHGRLHGLTAVDIYSGCGGLSAGLRDAGFRMAYALDWEKHACETHRINFPETTVACADVRTVRGEDILDSAGGSVDLLAGGPNCQGVSQRGLRSPDDPRNFMFPEFLRLVEEVSPRMVLMENVPGLAHRHNFNLLRTIFDSFQQLGYRCAADVLLAADYGVPQLRYRFALIGTRGDEHLSFPLPTHAPEETLWQRPFVTLGEAIADLSSKPAKSADDLVPYASAAENGFQRYARETQEGVWNHTVSATEKINLDRARFIPEGGNWKDIPAHLLPRRFFECRMTDHSTTYARPRRDTPAFTITSLFGNITAGAFTHPTQNRAFTIREGARLQSFKDSFRFSGPSTSQYRQIGNAVPPLLSLAIGKHLRDFLMGEVPSGKPARITWESLSDAKAWDALPVLTPRFKALFGRGTRWPRGWGAEPKSLSQALDSNYRLKPHLRKAGVSDMRPA